MNVKVGDMVKIKIRGRLYWGKVTSYGMKYAVFNRNLTNLFFVQVPEINWGIIAVSREDILEVHITEEKVDFT